MESPSNSNYTLSRNAAMFSAAVLACVVGFVCPSRSQKTNNTGVSPQTPAVRSATELVLLDISVEDKKTGEPIKDLKEEDFVFRDNGKPVVVSSFGGGNGQKLRPLQLWFVLNCNEEVVTDSTGYKRAYIGITKLGSQFLVGTTPGLAEALQHLGSDETVGVAHWCHNGETEIDLPPTLNREAPLKTMEEVASRKSVYVKDASTENIRENTLRMINEVVRTAFPPPFTAVVFVGGKQSGADSGKDNSVGSVGFLSMEFGMQEGVGLSEATGQSEYSVEHNEYGQRLSTIIEILHSRYEAGFPPAKDSKKVHHISVTLTKDTQHHFPNALLRYRNVYSDEPEIASQSAQPASYKANWKHLDSRMQAAVTSPADLDAMKFSVSRTDKPSPGTNQQFVMKIGPDQLTWTRMPNGDRRCIITAVVASFSAEGKTLGLVVKDLEIVQEFARLAVLMEKPVVLPVTATVEKGTVRIRLVIRDVASGHIGSQDLR
jgi:hypothetical protein